MQKQPWTHFLGKKVPYTQVVRMVQCLTIPNLQKRNEAVGVEAEFSDGRKMLINCVRRPGCTSYLDVSLVDKDGNERRCLAERTVDTEQQAWAMLTNTVWSTTCQLDTYEVQLDIGTPNDPKRSPTSIFRDTKSGRLFAQLADDNDGPGIDVCVHRDDGKDVIISRVRAEKVGRADIISVSVYSDPHISNPVYKARIPSKDIKAN